MKFLSTYSVVDRNFFCLISRKTYQHLYCLKTHFCHISLEHGLLCASHFVGQIVDLIPCICKCRCYDYNQNLPDYLLGAFLEGGGAALPRNRVVTRNLELVNQACI